MTPNPISDAKSLHFCRFFTLNVPVNLTFSKEVVGLYRIVTLCSSLENGFF